MKGEHWVVGDSFKMAEELARMQDKVIRDMMVSSSSVIPPLNYDRFGTAPVRDSNLPTLGVKFSNTLITNDSWIVELKSSLDGVREIQTYEVNSAPYDFFFAPEAIDVSEPVAMSQDDVRTLLALKSALEIACGKSMKGFKKSYHNDYLTIKAHLEKQIKAIEWKYTPSIPRPLHTYLKGDPLIPRVSWGAV